MRVAKYWGATRFRVPPADEGLSALLVVYGVIFTVTRVNFSTFTNELIFRGDSHASLKALLNNPKVRAGMRCGPVSTPILKAPVKDVIARSDATQRARIHRGVAIYATNRQSLLRSGLTSGVETPQDTANNLPMPGFTWVAATAYYGAYVRC